TVRPDGLLLCMVNMPGATTLTAAPICDDREADKEPIPNECWIRSLGDESGQLICAGSAYDLLLVKVLRPLIKLQGILFASVEHLDLPGGGVRLPVCEPMDEIPEERPCCIEEGTGLIVCPEGVDFPLAGKRIPLSYLEFATINGGRVARLRCGDVSNIDSQSLVKDDSLYAMWNLCQELGGYIFPVCVRKSVKPDRIPKDSIHPFPDICCYDPSAQTLICEGTAYHG